MLSVGGGFVAEYLRGFELQILVSGVLPDDFGLVVGLVSLDIALRSLMSVDSSGTTLTVLAVTADFDFHFLECRSIEKPTKRRAYDDSG